MNHPHTKPYGFTLVEMMIAVAIIGILATIALPSYNRYIERGYQAQAHTELININSLFKAWAVKNPAESKEKFKEELEKIVKDHKGEANIAGKYEFEAKFPDSKDNDGSRRYNLIATPAEGSGYSLSVWADSLGNAYKCTTPDAAKGLKKDGECEKAALTKTKTG